MQEVSVGLWMTQPPLFLLGGSGRGVKRPGVPGRVDGVGARPPTKDANKGDALKLFTAFVACQQFFSLSYAVFLSV